ncbi:MAG: aldehyde dehydrogenase [Hyphomicrobiales bacterium]|nr:aldehyde dehydrogenase [Hyphomicrobiales bacterium]MBP9174082.1 aldehyde dehydrogenase [Hyphomicrobiales bacterium]MCC7480268.1 aldehyde dehydrogenase [Hyphomicrobiales bacterium]HQX83965.1 aldehyde dehydrogenase [Aestuariivirga sp.]
MAEPFQLYIDGAFGAAEGGATFKSTDPSTGKAWALMPKASAADTDRAVRAASAAFNAGPWPAMTATARGKLLCRLAELVTRDAAIIAELETRDTGKVIRETKAVTGYVAEYYRYFAGLADKIEGATFPIDKPDLEVSTRREPLGVVAAIVPWNSQMFLAATKLGPALAAGNTVVIKASEDGPAPLLHFARLVHEAGFPAGVVNIITGFGADCGEVLTSHPLVARVAFTGGPETARHVVRNTAENFAVTTLELGGKSPVIVFDDANLDSALNGVIAGIWGATGQSCVAGSRLLVHESIQDEFVARLARRAGGIKIGLPLDMATEMGPLATLKQVQRAEKLITESLAAGAVLVAGGKSPMGDGYFFEPTILLAPSAELPCAREEFFGPVLSVLKFNTEDEAVALANGTAYAFAAGIFTQNLGRAHRLTKKIRAGVVWVNSYRAVSPIVPFGGNGYTGYGRESGLDAIRDYTRTKSIWINTSDAPMADPFVMR